MDHSTHPPNYCSYFWDTPYSVKWLDIMNNDLEVELDGSGSGNP
jgi:hypothetical protein